MRRDPRQRQPCRAICWIAAVAIAAPPAAVRAQTPEAAAPPPVPAGAQDPGKSPQEKTAVDPNKPVESTPTTAPPSPPQAELVAPANNVSPNAGLGGQAVSANDPEAQRAKADLEGTSLPAAPAEGVPERLPPLQRAAWWSMFGAFALASVGGVFGGLAEVEEDRAARLTATLDPETGAQLDYAGVQDEYEEILARGRRDAAVARGLVIAGAAVLLAGIGLFIADGVKRRRQQPRVRAGLGGLQVRF